MLQSLLPNLMHHRPTCFCAQSASRFGHGLTPAALGCALCHCTARVQMVLIVAGRLACSFTSMGYSGFPWVSVQLHRSILYFLNVFSLLLRFPNIWSFTFVALFVSVKHYISSDHPPFPPYVINITRPITWRWVMCLCSLLTGVIGSWLICRMRQSKCLAKLNFSHLRSL